MTWRSRIETEIKLQAFPGAGGGATASLDGRLQRMSIKRGRTKGTERMQPGIATLELVDASPTTWTVLNPGGAGGSAVWLGSLLTVRARVDGGTWRELYAGTIRSLSDDWQLDGRLRISLAAIDHLGTLAAITPDPADSAPAEGIVARLQRLDDIAPGAARDGVGSYEDFVAVNPGTLQAVGLDRNLLDEAMLAAESEMGELWAGRGSASMLRYRDQAALQLEPRYTDDQIVWANATLVTSVWDTATWDSGKWSTPAQAVKSRTFATEVDTDEVVTRVTLQRVGGTAITRGTITDSGDFFGADEALTGRRTYQRTDLIASDDTRVNARAGWLLWQLSDRTHRLEKLSTLLDPASPAALLDALLDVELHTRHRVTWTAPGGTYDAAMHVQGVEHTVTDHTWAVAVSLWHFEGT